MSKSIVLKPQDSRCKYWAKIVRKGAELPLPSAVTGAANIPGAYVKGDEEIFEGDFVFQGEENHHRNNRGWTYWVSWVDADGKYHSYRSDYSAQKAELKGQGLDPTLLTGSGDVAGMVRIAHGIALGMTLKSAE